jgi:hypothetical protein
MEKTFFARKLYCIKNRIIKNFLEHNSTNCRLRLCKFNKKSVISVKGGDRNSSFEHLIVDRLIGLF